MLFERGLLIGQADVNTSNAFGILVTYVGALRTLGAPVPLTLGVQPITHG